MSGYPSIPDRAAFGSLRYTDDGLELDPDEFLPARVLDLIAWQITGLGMVADRAWVLVAANGDRVAQGSGWDQPRKDEAGAIIAPPALPTIAHPSTGVYVITWPATAPNEQGESIAIGFLAGAVDPQSTSRTDWTIDIAANVVTVNLYDKVSGSLVDRKFMLKVR
jgi:hypothetical protein